MRRIQSVSVTIPGVIGPYTSVNCTLTLLGNRIRIKPEVGADYAEREDGEDDRFVRDFAAMQSIVTSYGQNDFGLFESGFPRRAPTVRRGRYRFALADRDAEGVQCVRVYRCSTEDCL